jgi:ABC-2 type transport system ATP-binding protein
VLELVNLRKRYGSLTAVDGLSVTAHAGEVLGLLGPNGAGKSTTIGMAMGLIEPDEGEVRIVPRAAGQASGQAGEQAGAQRATLGPRSVEARSLLGIAPQSLALYDQLTGEENLRYFGRLMGLSGKVLSQRVEHVLGLVALSPRKKDRVATYSGGMKRRLNLAAALVHNPPIVLLDEPTAGVDPQSRNNLLDVVRQLAHDGCTVIYTTHYMEEASRLCSRVGIIDQGKLLAFGTVPELIAAHGGKPVVTIGYAEQAGLRHEQLRHEHVASDDPLATIREALQPGVGKAEAREVRIQQPDLETVFLNLTGRRLRD